jgi:hypothetical protein
MTGEHDGSMRAPAVADVLDPGSIEMNRLGRLSAAQVRHVYRVGIGSWAINAMFVAAIGGLLAYALPFPAPARILVGIMTAIVAVYMLSRSYDAFLDSRGDRVAAVTGRGRPVAGEASAMPLGGTLRGDQWRQRCEVAGRTFWLPSSAVAMALADEVTVYFVPRSNVVVNVETSGASGS